MAEDHLDVPEIGFVPKQMGRHRMPEDMGMVSFPDAGVFYRRLEDAGHALPRQPLPAPGT